MDSQDENDYCRLSPDDRHDYLLNLAVCYLTREDARTIMQCIRQSTKDQTGVRVLSHPQDFTQQTANVFALNFAKVLSCFNVSTDCGENLEWEVGNRSRYDDFGKNRLTLAFLGSIMTRGLKFLRLKRNFIKQTPLSINRCIPQYFFVILCSEYNVNLKMINQ